jgi:hypothetical protein
MMVVLLIHSTYSDEIIQVTTPQEYVKVLNWYAEKLETGVVFRCTDYEADRPILEIHTPYSTEGLKMYKAETRKMMEEVSLNWYLLTKKKSSTVYVFNVGNNLQDLEEDELIYILEKGDLIEPGLLI